MFVEQPPTRNLSRCRETGLASLLFGGITLSLCDKAQAGAIEDRRGQEGLHSWRDIRESAHVKGEESPQS